MKELKTELQGAKSRQEIALEYGLHRNTLNRRLKKIGLQIPKGLICPADQKRIYEALGNPQKQDKDLSK